MAIKDYFVDGSGNFSFRKSAFNVAVTEALGSGLDLAFRLRDVELPKVSTLYGLLDEPENWVQTITAPVDWGIKGLAVLAVMQYGPKAVEYVSKKTTDLATKLNTGFRDWMKAD